MKIFKYVLPVAQWKEVEMPEGADILSVQAQNDKICCWALVEPENPMVKRSFVVHGTGTTIGSVKNLKYIATVLTLGGNLVWHVFEKYGPESELS